MKTDIITVVILVFCVGVLVSALNLGELLSTDQSDNTVALQAQQ